MATTTSTGAVGGSVIDVSSLVSQLIAAERAPADKRISDQTTKVTTQISALATLKSSLSTFQSALESLKTTKSFDVRSATSSDDKLFTAAADSSSVPGTYNVEVKQLAKSQQLLSGPFATGSSQVVGTGSLSISLGSSNFSVTIDSTNSTLTGIRDAINSATDNPGVNATIVQGTDGAHLVLSSTKTGAANTIQVAQSGGDGGLAALTYAPGNTSHYTQLTAAADSIVEIAGLEHTSSTNTVTGAIDGVTLTLTDEAPGTVETLTVAQDSSTAKTRINNFVAAYNALQTQLNKLGAYDATTQTGGPMLGDALLRGVQSDLRRTLSAQVDTGSTNYSSLASIGITTQADGTLAVDDARLDKAISTGFTAVSKLFGSSGGVADQLYTQIDARLKSDGSVDTRSKSLVKQQKDLTDQQTSVDDRMTQLQQMYTKQFSALDTLLSSLQTTSSYLTQQLASLPKPFNSSSG